MTYPNDPYSTETTPNTDGTRPPRHRGGGGLYALIGAAVIAALVVVAFVVGAFDTETPTGAALVDPPVVTEERPVGPPVAGPPVTNPSNIPNANPATPPAGATIPAPAR